MKRKIFALFSVCMCLILLSSCVVKTQIVKDNNDVEYLIKRDEDGFAQTDKKNYLIVYETDENGDVKKADNGQEVTSAVKFPKYITQDRTVETGFYLVEIPDGWSLQKDLNVKLINDENKADIVIKQSSYTADEYINYIKDTYENWNPDWQESEEEFDFATAKVLTSSKLAKDLVKTYYVFSVEGKTYMINTSFNPQIAENVDFASVIGELKFKKLSD